MNHSKETVLKTVSELFDLVKEKQSKVDALTLQVAEMKSRLNDAYTDGQSAMYTARQSKVDELQKRVDAAQKLIDDWNFGGVHIFDLLDELEQALKGEQP